MKKSIITLAIAVLLVGVVGCGTKKGKVECVKEYSGTTTKYTLSYEESKITHLLTEQVTEIAEADQIESSYQNYVNQIPQLNKIYPNAKIEAVKDGSNVGVKMDFDTKTYTFDKLSLEFKLTDTQETVENLLKENGFICTAIK